MKRTKERLNTLNQYENMKSCLHRSVFSFTCVNSFEKKKHKWDRKTQEDRSVLSKERIYRLGSFCNRIRFFLSRIRYSIVFDIATEAQKSLANSLDKSNYVDFYQANCIIFKCSNQKKPGWINFWYMRDINSAADCHRIGRILSNSPLLLSRIEHKDYWKSKQ